MPRSPAIARLRATTDRRPAPPRTEDLVHMVGVHDSTIGRPIADGDVTRWLLGPGRLSQSIPAMLDELCWRLVGDGVPLCRASLNLETLHPQIQGVMFRWWREREVTEEITY